MNFVSLQSEEEGQVLINLACISWIKPDTRQLRMASGERLTLTAESYDALVAAGYVPARFLSRPAQGVK